MQTATFTVTNFTEIKKQLLTWANRFSSCSFLDNHQYKSNWQFEECVVAVDAYQGLDLVPGEELLQVQRFIDKSKGQWIFGHFGYHFGELIQNNRHRPGSLDGFAACSLFVPKVVVKLSYTTAEIFSLQQAPETVWNEIISTELPPSLYGQEILLSPALPKEEYLATIAKLKEHIHRGDCYEINFCQEFFSNNVQVSPAEVYTQLAEISPNPFSCFYKQATSYLMCASPERFIARKGNRIFSQPIKGTATREYNTKLDAENISKLRSSEKEKSENVMVVDLVRNDLSRVCREGTVQVDELFGIYTYPQLHQMISTISGELRDDVSFTDILAATFPMGSMTGAPKKRVMELIETYETGNRGLFSGAVGYMAPNGDFDFNVVIRSLLYNQESQYLSYWVGSGITWYSQPEAEYEECLLKAAAIKKVLQSATLS